MTVDEAIRQVVAAGADPDRIGILDNFSMGDPNLEEKLGELVETARGMAEAARQFSAPFISGKDSFYNSFETPDGETISVPMTLVVSALGIVENVDHTLGTALTEPNLRICLLGETRPELRGSAYSSVSEFDGSEVPDVDPDEALRRYRLFYECLSEGLIQTAHDVSEGGLGVCLAEMSFGERSGVTLDLERVPGHDSLDHTEALFSESGGRIVFAVQENDVEAVRSTFADQPFAVIGRTTEQVDEFLVSAGDEPVVDESIKELKQTWVNGLEQSY